MHSHSSYFFSVNEPKEPAGTDCSYIRQRKGATSSKEEEVCDYFSKDSFPSILVGYEKPAQVGASPQHLDLNGVQLQSGHYYSSVSLEQGFRDFYFLRERLIFCTVFRNDLMT